MSRSKSRRRSAIIRARVTPDEKKIADAKAKTMGSMGALFRSAVLGYTPPRSADRDVMVKLLAQFAALRSEMGKIGSNLNQLAHHLNAGRPGDRMDGSLSSALQEYENVIRTLDELRLMSMQAMGQERGPKPDKDDR